MDHRGVEARAKDLTPIDQVQRQRAREATIKDGNGAGLGPNPIGFGPGGGGGGSTSCPPGLQIRGPKTGRGGVRFLFSTTGARRGPEVYEACCSKAHHSLPN